MICAIAQFVDYLHLMKRDAIHPAILKFRLRSMENQVQTMKKLSGPLRTSDSGPMNPLSLISTLIVKELLSLKFKSWPWVNISTIFSPDNSDIFLQGPRMLQAL